MASAKSSNSKVRSMSFFSSSHSEILFKRSLSSGAFIKSGITGQRVTLENRFATPKRACFKDLRFSLDSLLNRTPRPRRPALRANGGASLPAHLQPRQLTAPNLPRNENRFAAADTLPHHCLR